MDRNILCRLRRLRRLLVRLPHLGLALALSALLVFPVLVGAMVEPQSVAGPQDGANASVTQPGDPRSFRQSPLNTGPHGQSTLGDFVWHDLNGDGLQDPGEPGIDMVLVQLYLDNGDGSFDPTVDRLEYQVVTGNNPSTPEIETGWYEFQIDLTDAFYWVYIPPSNFAPDGPLDGYLHTSAGVFGPNPMLVYLPGGIQT